MTSSRLGDNEENQSIFASFSGMEHLLDKLKLLSYDEQFSKNMRPINRHYFALPTNPGEQFFMFTSLAAWLFSRVGLKMEVPQEADDPNSLIATLLDFTRQLDIPVAFPPNKLKQGFGFHAIFILDAVADKALNQAKFIFKKPHPPKETTTEEVAVEDESELFLEKIEEEMVANISSEDEDALINIDDLCKFQSISFEESGNRVEHILESNVNEEEWKLSVERVLPLLRVTFRTDMRDWRSHLDQMRSHKQIIEATITTVNSQLERIFTDMGTGLNKISTREKMLNSHLSGKLTQFRTIQDELRLVTERYREMSLRVQEKQKQLNKMMDKLAGIQQEMGQRGSFLTDGSPLINIKKAIMDLKCELKILNVQLGVADHTLLQALLRDRVLCKAK